MAPHFKKLTDCPENLREAIDWLIQVRHGNGGNGEGINKLGQALKKLIDEAITKAAVSIIDELCKLLDPWKAKPCCKAKLSAIEKLKETVNKFEHLEDASRRGLLRVIQGLKNDCTQHHYINTSTSKAFDDIQSRFTQLENLQNSLNGFTDQKSCETLLTNLCSGLETFLGFNSESKGYDGTGIVYSDLDRLCDGVMGFLRGVLENVKRDSNIMHYDVNQKHKISDLPGKIKGFMYKCDGLPQAISAVSLALDAWDGELESRTKEVKARFNVFKNHNCDEFNKTLNEISALNGSSLSNVGDKVGRCMEAAVTLKRSFDAASIQLCHLDPGLENELQDAARKMEMQVEKLVTAACNTELRELLMLSEEQVMQLGEKVNRRIEQRVNQMTMNINNEFDFQINKPIFEVQQNVEDVKMALAVWIDNAKKYLNEVLQHVNKIVKKTTGSAKVNTQRDAIQEAASKLHEYAVDFWYAAGMAQNKVNDLVPKALNAVKEMDKKLKIDLLKVKTKINSEVDAIKNAIGKLCKVVSDDVDGDAEDEDKKVANILGEILSMVGLINGATALSGIGVDVQGYSRNFTKEHFKMILEQWMRDILKNGGTVDAYLTDYVGGGNSVYFKKVGQGELKARVVPKVEKVIQETVKPIISNVKSDSSIDSANVSNNFKHMKEFLVSFANELTKSIKFKSIDLHVIVRNIKEAINVDSDLVEPTYQTGHQQSELYDAVEGILNQLVGRAEGAADKIQKLLTDGNFTKVDNAIRLSAELEKNLRKALALRSDGESDPAGTKYAEIVDGSIDAVTKTLDVQMPKVVKNSTTRVTLETETWFTNYHVCVKQNSNAIMNDKNLTGEQEDFEGSLPRAIGVIRDEVKGALEGLVRDGTLRHAFEAITKNFEEFCNEVAKFIDKDALKPFGHENGLKQMLEQMRSAITEKGGKATITTSNGSPVNVHGLTQITDDIEKILGTNPKTKIQNGNLADITAAARNFDESVIQAQVKMCIENIKQYLDAEVDSVTQEIRTTAKNAYYEKINGMFAAMKSEVMTQLVEVESIIQKDLVTGVKGFLKRLKKKFIANLLEIGIIMQGANHKFIQTTKAVNLGFKHFFDDLYNQIDFAPYFNKMNPLSSELIILLTGLSKSGHFDNTFSNNLDEFNKSHTALIPMKFSDQSNMILQALKNGCEKMYKELSKAYVSKYSGEIITWSKKDYITLNAMRCANAFITIIPTLAALMDVNVTCMSSEWSRKFIFDTTNKVPIAPLLKQHGYDIPSSDAKQDGELRCSLTGMGISALLTKDDKFFKYMGKKDSVFQTFLEYIKRYYTVCHFKIPQSESYPCTIRDMLSWMCGLRYTAVYSIVKNHCESLINNDKTYSSDTTLLYILRFNLSTFITTTCRMAHELLVTIQGHGCGGQNVDYPYACNFSDNSRGFHYPTNVPDLLYMLRDICERVLTQLTFLRVRCRATSQLLGWSDCSYGNGVHGYQWNCDTHYGSDSNCHPKSPLQAHLMDALIGFIPHNLSSNGLTVSCSTCPKGAPGQRCIAPMGFWDLPDASSISKKGSDIHNVLRMLCQNASSPLCGLLRCLKSLCPVAPRNLADMFAFFCNLMQRWTESEYRHGDDYQSAINDNISSCFPLPILLHDDYSAATLSNAMRDLCCADGDHRNEVTEYNHSGLYSLSMKRLSDQSTQCDVGNSTCAPYIQPLGLHANHTYTTKYAALYVSWFTHLAWDFWESLECLLNAFKNISCKSSGCSSCNCRSGNHGVTEEKSPDAAIAPKSGCRCSSIVHCQGVISTFYQYGFTFRIPKELLEGETRRTCEDFVKQLNKVLYKGYFKKLFEEIDRFLFAIRMPFFYFIVALWLLSLLYLIHIMVIRLDLLHIKSHLHSPSSHRIAAQSLLAAARVGKLAKLTYLQP